MWIGLSALAAIAAGCFVVWLCRSAQCAWARAWRFRPWFEKVVLAGLLSVCVLFGGEKTRSGVGPLGDRALPGVTAEEIAQGWRLESVATNDAASYAMPTNGVEYGPWSLRGGRDTHFALDLGDFAFPFGTGVVHRLDVLSGGMVESLPRQRVERRYSSAMSICAARERASLVPGVSRFWRVVSGPGRIVATNGWCATVEPTGANEDVIVEARFNGDEIQPRFVLPVVQPRTIPVRLFVVEPPDDSENEAWSSFEVLEMLDTANEIFTQVGIRFELAGGITSVGTTNDWNLALGEYSTNAQERSVWRYSSACTNLLANRTAADCIEIYFTGSITFPKHYLATTTPYGIVIGRRKAKPTALAHELGHALGLEDCRARMMWRSGIMASIAGADDPLDGAFFIYGEGDWGKESGRGFYGVEDTRIAAMGRMLMQVFSLDERADIPAGFVISLTPNSATEAPSLCHPKVGANHVKERNEEAYSR